MTATLDHLSGQTTGDAHGIPAAEVPNFPADHLVIATQRTHVGGDPTPEQAIDCASPRPSPPARGSTPPAPAKTLSRPIAVAPVLADPNVPTPATPLVTPTADPPGSAPSDQPAPWLADPFLALAADVLDDLESVRVANENRVRQLTRTEADADGEERGFGLTEDHPDVARLAALVADLAKAEHQAALNLARLVRRHPLGPWIRAARGVGEKQGSRLLAAIGDPYWNTLHNRPRTVSELWAYCGYHVLPAGQARRDDQSPLASGGPTGGNPDQTTCVSHRESVGVAATRVRGQKANWSAGAKMRAYLVAEKCVQAGKAVNSPYYQVYAAGRAKYDDAAHQAECRRCGPSGKPAQPGSPLSAGHQHARALRLVAKEVLKDLWRESKRLHDQTAN